MEQQNEPNWDAIEQQAREQAEAMREDEIEAEVISDDPTDYDEDLEPEKARQAEQNRAARGEVMARPDRGVAPSRDQSVERGAPKLVEFAANLRLAYGAAQSLVKTSFVPKSFHGRPEEAAAAIVKGLDVGFDPMAALSEINVIQGTPALSALSLRAIVQAKGHQIWVEESTTQRAIVQGIRKGEDRVQESNWDLDRAKQLGLTSKDNWRKQPKAMLLARATSELVRLIAADDILGLAYSAEELGDEVPVADAAPVKRASSTISRKPRAVTPKPTASKPVAKPEPTEKAEPSSEPAKGEPSGPVASGELEGFAELPEGFES